MCLPTSEDFLEPETAVVAGWGFQYKECQTDFWGPKKFEACSERWRYKNKTYFQVMSGDPLATCLCMRRFRSSVEHIFRIANTASFRHSTQHATSSACP